MKRGRVNLRWPNQTFFETLWPDYFGGSDGHLQFWCFMVSLKPVLAKAPVCVFPSSYSVHLCIPIWPKCLIPKYSPSPYFATQPHHKDVSSSRSISYGIVSLEVEGTFYREHFEDMSALFYGWLVESWKISSAAVFLRKCHQCEEYFNKRRRCTTDRSGVLLPWPTFNKQTLIHLCLTSFCTE